MDLSSGLSRRQVTLRPSTVGTPKNPWIIGTSVISLILVLVSLVYFEKKKKWLAVNFVNPLLSPLLLILGNFSF